MVLDNNAEKEKQKIFCQSYILTPDYSNFYEKVDGIKIRKKFRIRSYSNSSKKINNIFRNER